MLLSINNKPGIKMKKYFFLALFVTAVCFAQSKDPNVIIKNVKETFGKVKDYTADVDIKVDVSFLKVPEMKAKVYLNSLIKYILSLMVLQCCLKKGFIHRPYLY